MRFTCITVLLALTLAAPAAHAGGAAVIAQAPQGTAVIRQEWSENTFVPDVYPTWRVALDKTIELFARKVLAQVPEEITTIVANVPRNTRREVILQLDSELKRRFPRAAASCRIYATDGDEFEQAGPGALRVKMREIPTGLEGEGRIEVNSITPVVVSVAAGYVDKRWADQDGMRQHMQSGRYLVAWPEGPEATRMEAERKAVQAAAQQVLDKVLPQLQRTHRMWGGDVERIKSHIEAELMRGNYINDRFVQRFDRDYGTVWREAVLVDLASVNLNRIVGEVAQALHLQRVHVRNTTLSAAGMLVVVYLLYLFANSWTRGYFKWKLRTMALVVLAAGILVLVSFA